MSERIERHEDLDVYQRSFDVAMRVYQISKSFPPEERYSLTDQVRRFSRSVCANLEEAWRKRRYAKAFASKLSDAETEAAETQVWLAFATRCGYAPAELIEPVRRVYDGIIRSIAGMIRHADTWIIQHND
jgi:four helix bundle protein